jgi:hypothetical protein
MTKQSFGNGHGLHRGHSGGSAHALSKPPMGSVTVKPGVGKAHHKNVNFTAKIYKNESPTGSAK